MEPPHDADCRPARAATAASGWGWCDLQPLGQRRSGLGRQRAVGSCRRGSDPDGVGAVPARARPAVIADDIRLPLAKPAADADPLRVTPQNAYMWQLWAHQT